MQSFAAQRDGMRGRSALDRIQKTYCKAELSEPPTCRDLEFVAVDIKNTTNISEQVQKVFPRLSDF